MADLDHRPILTTADDQPIALRKKRRSSVAPSVSSSATSSVAQIFSNRQLYHGISTPPTTPRRVNKKRVRFSDPGPAIPSPSNSTSSGLTPFMRKTALSLPKSKRRHSTPASLLISNRVRYDEPISGEMQFAPLRQVLDGRVKRRLRRNRLSEEVNMIEWDKRQEAIGRKLEVERLRKEVAAKDLQMKSMQEEWEIASQIEGESGMSLRTISTQNTEIQELKRTIQQLRDRIEQKETERDDDATIEDLNWTMAAQDPFDFNDDDDDNMNTNYDMEFYNDDEIDTTPTRLNTSFPSPSSTIPNSPFMTTSSSSAGIQASLPIPDPEKDILKQQLDSLQSHLKILTSTIAFNEDRHARMEQKLAHFIPVDESHDQNSLDSALDTVLTKLALSQSHSLEQQNALSALGTEIGNLGFPSSGPEQALETIAQQFRQARLDLEYLTPGEVVEGFENEKLLEMFISRMKVLLARVKKADESIDQYHDQELLLREQINTRVSISDDLNKELHLANNAVAELMDEVEETEVSNQRLRSALEKYRLEVTSLEQLIEKLEHDAQQSEAQLRSQVNETEDRLQNEILKHDTTRALAEGKDIIITELTRRLNAALQTATEVQDQLAALEAAGVEKDAQIEQAKVQALSREMSHSEALAICDAHVSELRQDVERVNESLKSAQSLVLGFQNDIQLLESKLTAEKQRGMFFAKAMNEMSMDYMTGSSSTTHPAGPQSSSLLPGSEKCVVRPGQFTIGGQSAKKKRRRYDSGLGFLDEEGELEMEL